MTRLTTLLVVFSILFLGVVVSPPTVEAATERRTDIHGISSALSTSGGPQLRHVDIALTCNPDRRACQVDSAYTVVAKTAGKRHFSLYVPSSGSLKISVGGHVVATPVTSRNLPGAPLYVGFDRVSTDFYGRVYYGAPTNHTPLYREGDQWQTPTGVNYKVTAAGVSATFGRGNKWGQPEGTQVPAEWLAKHPLDIEVAHEATFDLDLPAGESTIRVQHSQPISTVNVSSGFSHHTEIFALYDLWTLDAWTKTSDFRADVHVAHRAEFGWWDRLFDNTGITWKPDTRRAVAYDTEDRVTPNLATATTRFTGELPDRIYAEYEH